MDEKLIERFSIKKDYPLAPISWFKTGGNAEYYCSPKSVEELSELLKEVSLPITIIGNMSNILISDKGLKGLVIKLNNLNKININNDEIEVEAGCLNKTLCSNACRNGLSGLEFLNAIPGTVGGAIKMNAGVPQREIKDIVKSCKIINFHGDIYDKSLEELGFKYRGSNTNNSEIILSAKLKLDFGKEEEIYATMQEMFKIREKSQPIKERTGGSTFKNPEGHSAWKLIDEAGLRGYSIGGAKISEKHTNFIINYNNAKSSDIENLINLAKEKVFQNSGIKLESEIKILGEK